LSSDRGVGESVIRGDTVEILSGGPNLEVEGSIVDIIVGKKVVDSHNSVVS